MRDVAGRLVLPDGIAPGRIFVEDGLIAAVERDDAVGTDAPFLLPGFIDVHVHGWGGHDAMGGPASLDGMARALLRHGVTSFLPTAVTASIATLTTFAQDVRSWLPGAPSDGAAPLGFNLEGPFLNRERKGAQNAAHIVAPADVDPAAIEPLVDGLRVITIAPEMPGAIELVGALAGRGVAVSLGHSAATLAEARAGYAAGARTTTHLFNAMSGVDHRAPGLAVAALLEDEAYTELIADGHHVVADLWPLVRRLKASDRLLLVSDALSLAGMGEGRGVLGGLEVEVIGDRCTLVVGGALAGSVIALDTAVRNLVRSGASLPEAAAAASSNPAQLLGAADRGELAVGRRADVVVMGADLSVRRVMRAGEWLA
jgi:N-acetylglucosamine-6-phosphate deacetylase